MVRSSGLSRLWLLQTSVGRLQECEGSACRRLRSSACGAATCFGGRPLVNGTCSPVLRYGGYTAVRGLRAEPDAVYSITKRSSERFGRSHTVSVAKFQLGSSFGLGPGFGLVGISSDVAERADATRLLSPVQKTVSTFWWRLLEQSEKARSRKFEPGNW